MAKNQNQNEVRYTLKERADFYAKLARTGISSTGKKMDDAQKMACAARAAKLQDRATREAKRYENYKNNPR